MGSEDSIDTKKPKVFIWVGGWKGGAENVMLGIAEILREEFSIIPTLGVFEKNVEVDFPQIVVKRLFPRRLAGYNSIWASLYLRKKGILDKFDIVITHTGGFWKTEANFYVYHEAADLNRILKNLSRISKVIYFPIYVIALRSLNEADLVFSASPECSLFLNRLGVKHEKTSSFVDTTIFKPLNLKRENAILFAGRGDKGQKNLDLLLSVIKTLPFMRLYITGKQNLGVLPKNVKYLGWVSLESLVVLYNKVRAFVLPSKWEGFPLTILEALACKTPVIASIYSVPNLLWEYVYVFNPTSQRELKSAILDVLFDPKKTKKRTLRGYYIVIKKYRKENVLARECKLILYSAGFI